ncbi:ABC transporter ATP-binding protein [Paradevosia shaoguanensis]|uniref:ABC transporter ATP-binding protein n=1 Tax=Paradevosia shaoguanensis TaxID=1335043 RepID=UPI001934031F|nr:ABC transporter ATP-binding protein [Paradevosia shaoguanensis]
MAYLSVANATKRFGETFTALKDVSISVERGEFFTLLGPSGCGKTTLLRSIAGFNQLTSGSIAIEGRDLGSVPPHKRDIGMVFQDYAVFPHLTVFENVAFGLKARKVARDEIARRVPKALEAVRLGALAERLPAAMSGGQQQRIGLARAMVINPQLLLMDEPLSNLDAKLRVELREEIRDIQKQIGIAAIYVTHDQEEALAISDRICVMSNGHVEQLGTPQEIYGNPQTLFVASFVGTINALKPGEALTRLLGQLDLTNADNTHPGATWVVRPENLIVAGERAETGEPQAEITGTVSKYTYLGREAHLQIHSDLGDLVVHVANPDRTAVQREGEVRVVVTRSAVLGFGADGKRIGV